MSDRCGICHREPCRCCVEYIDTDMADYIDSLKAERDRLRAALVEVREAIALPVSVEWPRISQAIVLDAIDAALVPQP